MCIDGIGGKIDLFQAYVYISAAARSTDPSSFNGEKLWPLREELAAKLSKAELTRALTYLDNLEFKEMDGVFEEGGDAFLQGAVPDQTVDAGMARAEEMEAAHRKGIGQREQ